MSALSVEVPFPVFYDRSGEPLENGYVWIGQANLNPQTNPIQVYFDKNLTQPAAQPLRTLAGYIANAGTPAQIYVDAVNYSILVQDKNGTMVYNFPDGTGISATLNACAVEYDPPFIGGVEYPVCEKLEQTVSVKDFGAVGDGVADDTVAIQAAVDSGAGLVYVPDGVYKFTAELKLPPNTHLQGPHGLARKYNPSTAKCRLAYDGTDTVAVRLVAEASTGAATSTISNLVIQQINTISGVTAIAIGGAGETPTYALSTKVNDVLVSNFTGIGIYNFGSWNCTLTDVMVHGAAANRTGFGYKFDNLSTGATSCYFTNCAAEECVVGFEIGNTTVNRIYSYSSLINTYVDGCTTAYRFLGDGTSTRVVHAYNIGLELVDGGNAILADGAYVSIDGLSMFPNGTGFSDVIKATNNALLSIANNDFIPQTGFGLTNSNSIVTADNAVVRFLNGDVTTAPGEVIQLNGGRVDVLSKDRSVYKNLERVNGRSIDLTVATRNLTYLGFSSYLLSTSAGANQAMAGTPVINTTGVNNGEIITFINMDATYQMVLRTENIVAGTGLVAHPDNVSGSGVVLDPQDFAQFVKKADGKLYEIRRGV